MNKKHYAKLVYVLFLLLTALTLSVKSAWSDKASKYVINEHEFSATPRHGQMDKSHLTILGFTVGKHSLQDIQTKLGQAETFSLKEHAPSQICYISKEPDKTIIIFEAGAMGSWKDLTGFRIMSNKIKFPESSKCKESNMISKDIKTKSGIKLGISKNKLRTILGKPTKVIDNNLFYVYETKRKMTKSEIKKTSADKENQYFDVSSNIHAIFLDSKMESVKINWVETY